MSRTISRSIIVVAALVLASGAHAQYFGKNRVQYRDFDWRIYHSPHFDVYHYTDDEQLQKVVSFAESAYDELSREFDYQIQEPTPLIVYETLSAFQQTNVILNGVPEGAQAFATSAKFRMVMPMDMPDEELLALIKHELTHIFQYYILFSGRLGGGLRGAPPLWFIEGMASFYADDETPGDRKYMVDAVVNDRIPSIRARGGGFFAYRFGNAVFSYIEERWGRDAVLDFVYEFRNTFGSQVGRAVERTFRMDVEDFDSDFRRWARQRYLPQLLETGEPGDFGRLFRLDRGEIGQELSPVASPSGDLVAALTTDRGEVDVSIFDARTRRRIRNISEGFDTEVRGVVVRTNRQDGRDLAFSPDGNYIAAFGRREASRSLLLYDVIDGGLDKIVDMPLDQQRSPTFSPDGRYIAFAANEGGTNDIYVIDLDTLEIQNLTDDPAFDSSPEFSPDGKSLVYSSVIDRHMQLFRLDLDDPTRRFQITNDESNNKEASYSPDGTRVYFASDRNGGIDNIYSIELDTGRTRQYTNTLTGADQPTILPRPDGSEQLVFSGYWKGSFGIYTAEVGEPIGEPVDYSLPTEPAVGSGLPRFEPDIEVTIDETNEEGYGGFNFFLEDADTVIGIDTASNLIGQIRLSWSDYLGDRRIFANVSAVDSFSDFDITYLNLQERIQWGARAFDTRVYAFTDPNELILDPFGNPDREEVYRITGLEGIGIYPLSYNSRFEVRLGAYYRDISSTIRNLDPSGDPVQVLPVRTDTYPQLSAAFVHDTTIFNQGGPIDGARVRVSGSYAPDFEDSGTLVTTALLDARRYIPTSRRTNFALRLVAYDSDGNAPNLIFFGGLDTLRGFPTNSVGGDRGFYANAEYRFPLIDRLQFPGIALQGIRGVIFADLGGAYFKDLEDFEFYEDDQLVDAVASFGFGVSVNLFGLPANWDFAKRTNLDQSFDDGFETTFWLGFRF